MEKKPPYEVLEQQVKELKDALAGLRTLAGMGETAPVLDAMADGITITDLSGRITYVNRILAERMGAAREMMLGKPAREFIHEEDREEVKGSILRVLSGKNPFETVPCRSVNGSGRELHMRIRFSLPHDARNKPCRMIAVGRDISKERKIADDHKEHEERLKILFDSVPDGIFLIDFKGAFLEGNRAAEELIGYKKGEVIGKDFLELKLIPPEEIPRVLRHLPRVAGNANQLEQVFLNLSQCRGCF